VASYTKYTKDVLKDTKFIKNCWFAFGTAFIIFTDAD